MYSVQKISASKKLIPKDSFLKFTYSKAQKKKIPDTALI